MKAVLICKGLFFAVLVGLFLVTPALGQSAAESAYRSGDYASAKAHWEVELLDLEGAEACGAVLYNLGNSAFRDGLFLEAVARYTAAIDHSPRSADYWANLELARSRAGLEAADRGDLAATAERLYTLLRVPELETLTFAILALLAASLLWEALRGSRTSRALATLFFLSLIGVAGLRTWRVETIPFNRVMVTFDGGASLRSEPSLELPVILHLEPGAIVERTDTLLGWMRVNSKGTSGWLEAPQVLELD